MPRHAPARSRTDARPARPGELAEREQRSGTRRNTLLVTVALLDQPRHIALDLRADPRPADPIDRQRLDEVLLQHGNFLSTSTEKATITPTTGVMRPVADRRSRQTTAAQGFSTAPRLARHITRAGS